MGLKLRHKVRGEIKWRYFAPSNTDASNPFRAMDQATRDDVRRDIYKLISEDKEVKTLACVTSAAAAYEAASINNQADLYHATYKPVTERFQYHLQSASKNGKKQLGFILADHRGAGEDKRLLAHHQKLLHAQSDFISSYKNLVEGLFLGPSNLSVGIQLADMVAGAVWRKFERNDDKFYNMLLPSLRKDLNGNEAGYGVVKMPKVGFR